MDGTKTSNKADGIKTNNKVDGDNLKIKETQVTGDQTITDGEIIRTQVGDIFILNKVWYHLNKEKNSIMFS